MITVRAATLALSWDQTSKENFEKALAEFFPAIRQALQAADFKLRTARLLLDPVNRWSRVDRFGANSVIRWISDECEKNDVRWFCLPFMALEKSDWIAAREVALECIRRYPNAFVSFAVSDQGRFNPALFPDLANFILDVSKLSSNGYDNFRVGLAANCAPNGPFFPYTRQAGANGFALAIEMPQVFHDLLDAHPGEKLPALRAEILKTLVPQLQKLEQIARQVESQTGLVYNGMDLSLAPFPEDRGSVGEIIEKVGVESFGSQGSIFAISFLTDILKSLGREAGVKTVGFNGVMISLLEDKILGIANSKKMYTLDSILAYSTVCGCGVDMVPLPGNILPEEMASLITDVTALSSVLQKPLGFRVLPIPGRGINDFTNFSYDFLYNSRVMDIRNRSLAFERFPSGEVFQYLSPPRKS
jgi:uncharacterized protein (UPF0210 family)